MQKQTTPEVPQGLTPALNSFLRWVREQLKGLALEKAKETADTATSRAGKAQRTADGATNAATKAQDSADSATTIAGNAQNTADNAVIAAATAQARADSAYTLANKANSTANSSTSKANNAQKTADDAYTMAQDVREGAVRFDKEQTLTAEQKTRARTNIGAAAFPAVPSSDGTYALQCSVSNGAVTYSWEEVE